MDYQLIPGHQLTLDVRAVTRHASSWNMDYSSTDCFLVCECGWEKQIFEGGEEERLIVIEHSIEVLGAPKKKDSDAESA